MMASISIEPATPGDLPQVLALLSASDLPHAGLAEHFDAALVARDGTAVVGSAALELYGEAALLRSVVVAEALRGQGLGRDLTTAALELARARGVRRVYLLTTTAEGYFPSFGFMPIPRATVEPAVQISAEFSGACPDSAAVLARDLGESPRRVLFLCTHNSARSQMAEGLLRGLGSTRFFVASAGTVATRVRPEAITVMDELGIDIRGQSSKTLERYVREPWDEVITVCDAANDACPLFPGGRHRRHWSIPDPAGVQGDEAARLAAFRAARDTLRTRIERELLTDHTGNAAAYRS